MKRNQRFHKIAVSILISLLTLNCSSRKQLSNVDQVDNSCVENYNGESFLHCEVSNVFYKAKDTVLTDSGKELIGFIEESLGRFPDLQVELRAFYYLNEERSISYASRKANIVAGMLVNDKVNSQRVIPIGDENISTPISDIDRVLLTGLEITFMREIK